MRTELHDLWDFHLHYVIAGFSVFIPTGSLTNVSTRDRLFGFTPPLSENRVSPAHLMIKNKYLFGLEVLFHPMFHVLYISSGYEGGVFEIIVGIRNLLLCKLEPMDVQRKVRFSAANVSHAYTFYIFIFHIGLSCTRQMIDGDVDREGFFSRLAFVEIKSPQITDATTECHDK